jgi:hypothetical protein
LLQAYCQQVLSEYRTTIGFICFFRMGWSFLFLFVCLFVLFVCLFCLFVLFVFLFCFVCFVLFFVLFFALTFVEILLTWCQSINQSINQKDVLCYFRKTFTKHLCNLWISEYWTKQPKNNTNKRVVVLLQKWRTTLAVTGKTGTNSYSPVLDVLLD